MNWDTIEKDHARQLAISHSTLAKQAVFVPGEQVLCMKSAVKKGVISHESSVLWFERDQGLVSSIKPQVTELAPNNRVINGSAFDVDSFRLGRNLKHQVDFAFFDFCNSITAEYVRWFVQVWRDKFSPFATVSFTFCLRTSGWDTPEAIRLYECAKIPDNTDTSKWSSRELGTLGLCWAMMACNYLPEIEEVVRYKAFKTPMLMVRMKLLPSKTNVTDQQVFDCVEACWYARKLEWPNKTLADRLGCHPAMSPNKKNLFVKLARSGKRPPWLNPAQWAWHEINPNGMRRAA